MLIVLYGKTGAGKDYLARYLKHNYNVEQLIRPTSRPKRTDRETSYYDFYTEGEFLKKVEETNSIFAVRNFRGWYYGVYNNLPDENKTYVLTGDKDTAFDVKDIFPKAVIIEVEADRNIRYNRAVGREEKPDLAEILRRMKMDDIDYASNRNKPDFYINNTNNGVEELKKIMEELQNGK